MTLFPENDELILLLNKWAENRTDEDYASVMQELMTGESSLLLPSLTADEAGADWTITEKDFKFNLTCIYEVDGVKTIGVFTDEGTILKWSNRRTPYIALKTKSVMELCEREGIYILVLNSSSDNMLVAQRSR